MIGEVPTLMSLVLAGGQPIIMKLLQHFDRKKKVSSVYIHDENLRSKTMSVLKSDHEIVVVDLDNYIGSMATKEELTSLAEIEKTDEYQFRQIYYVLCRKLKKSIIKNYLKSYKKIIFLSNDMNLLNFLKLNDHKIMMHITSSKVVHDEMTINKRLVCLVDDLNMDVVKRKLFKK